jgi:hypothetical protein
MDTPAARRLRPWLTTADGLVSVTANVWRAEKAGRQFE